MIVQSFSETHQICRAKCAVSLNLLIFCELLAFFILKLKGLGLNVNVEEILTMRAVVHLSVSRQ